MVEEIRKVLVVEDDAIALLIIKKTLERYHQALEQVRICKNGLEAFEYLIKMSDVMPDMILLDINMPIMTGWELLDELEHYHQIQEIPVMMLTSSISEMDVEKSKTYRNVKGYFSKPLTPDKLNTMFRLLKSKR